MFRYVSVSPRFWAPVLILVFSGVAVTATLQETDPNKLFEKAKSEQTDGNYQDAAKIYRRLIDSAETSEYIVAESLPRIQQCYRSLRTESELDATLESATTTHVKKPRVLVAAGSVIMSASHYGVVADSKFTRGYNPRRRVSGASLNCAEQDRQRAINWTLQAISLAKKKDRSPRWYLILANYLSYSRSGTMAWRLQSLTDLDEIPNYTELGQQQTFSQIRAPVDADGEPVLYRDIKKFANAKSDGQRYRWALERAMESEESRADAMLTWSRFLTSQFSVSTLSPTWGITTSGDEKSAIAKVHKLKDSQTIAKLVIGVKELELPEEFNLISVLRKVIEENESGSARKSAVRDLANIYFNRRQYPAAVAVMRLEPTAYPNYQQEIDAIIGPQLAFDPVEAKVAGEEAKLSFLFRNAKNVTFSAQPVDMEKLISELKDYYRNLRSDRQGEFGAFRSGGPANLDYLNGYFTRDSYDITNYLIGNSETWEQELEPRANHWDKRIQVALPQTNAGTYLVEASAEMVVDDRKLTHRARILVTLQDSMLVRHRTEKETIFRAVDANSGESLGNIDVEFFGYRWEDGRKNPRRTLSRNMAKKTNASGEVKIDLEKRFQWLAIARRDGKLSLLNFENFYNYGRIIRSYRAGKAYGIAERPVYRPGEKVRTKFWMAYTTYGDESEPRLANQQFRIRVNDGRGNKVHEQLVKTDAYGGAEVAFDIPKSASLGRYSFTVVQPTGVRAAPNQRRAGGGFGSSGPPVRTGDVPLQCSLALRVEEYRKPEFEVNVLAPSKPVSLGKTVEARVQAKYLFGAPVAGTAEIKVERSKHTDSYFPSRPYDWCYGPGYWWFNEVYDWYPGFRGWCGCFPIGGPGFGLGRGGWFGSEPPELVLEQMVELDALGEAVIEIDTALAKAAFGDEHDHRYSISVVVRDSSRRSIVGSGSVVAARTPFKVYTWTNRGYYNTGDRIVVNYQARQLDGSPVKAEGTLDILQLSYDADGKPNERVIATLPAKTDEQGRGVADLMARTAGQYRLRFRLESGDSGEVEGGYIYTVRGVGVRGDDFRFAELEITPDKPEYAPGDVAKVQIASNNSDAIVALFVRPISGVYTEPQYVQLKNKTAIVEIPITNDDQPNFHVEAYTVYDGEYHQRMKEIVVPPEDRVLQLTMKADKEQYLPGEEASVELTVKEPSGKPVEGSVVISAYDRALELVSPDTVPRDIREFFWKWRRNHYPSGRASSTNWAQPCRIDRIRQFRPLGVFGSTLADDFDLLEGLVPAGRLAMNRRGGMRALSGPMGGAGFGMGGGNVLEMADSAEGNAMPGAPMGEASSGLGLMAKSSARTRSQGPEAGNGGVQPPQIRKDFADSAIWLASLKTDAEGKAEATFKMPENLTGWKLRSWAMGDNTRVGSASTEAVTKKPLLVRLQTPRFLVERDEVVVSSIVHNDTKETRKIRVSLEIVGQTQLELMEGQLPEQVVAVKPFEQARVDWRCQALASGDVKLRTYAVGGDASDAMELSVPIVVYGAMKTDSWAGTVREGQANTEFQIMIPVERRAEHSLLTVRLSPSLAGAMLDSLPYLAAYPYGCTEQTLNRFLPAVLTQRVLQDMNLDLESIGGRRNNLNAQELGDAAERKRRWGSNPIFEKGKVDEMVEAGVNRLVDMQNQDGGWGWFSGTGSRSSAHLTSQVVRGLLVARSNNVAIPADVIPRGTTWLKNYQQQELQKLKNWDSDTDPRKHHVDNMDALVFHVLTLFGELNDEMKKFLYEDRTHLSVYGKCLFALATHQLEDAEMTNMLKRNIEQFLEVDEENETALLTDQTNWWHWYGSSIESTAMYLTLLTKTDPDSITAPRLVKYLLNNRKHATYWNSTRDTALVVEAFADYLDTSEEISAESQVDVLLDGKLIGSIEFTKENLFDVNNTIQIAGDAIPSGEHQLTIRRRGKGNMYWNVYARNFTREQEIEKAGLEVKVERRYYLLEPSKEELQLAGKDGRVVEAKGDKQLRVQLDEEVEVPSGRMIEVELLIESKNDYEYLLVEDKKPAGLEPVDSQSGYFYSSGIGVYRELREKHVGLLIERLPRGRFSVRYEMRSESPGAFTALPATIEGMYAPELVGNSRDFDLKVID